MVRSGVFSAIFEFILYLFVDGFFKTLCFHLGQLLVRLISFGKSPKYPHDHETGLSLLGMFTLLGPPFIYLLWIS